MGTEEHTVTVPGTPSTRTGTSPRDRLPLLTAGALLAGLVLSIALTTLLAGEVREEAGEWGAVTVFATVGTVLAAIDARSRRLPNLGTIPLAAGILGYWTGLAFTTEQWALLTQAIVTAAAMFLFTMAIGMIGSLAFGDIKLLIAISLLTGWFSWLLPVYALIAGYLLALPHAVLILTRRRRQPELETQYPFGPYLVAGTLLVTLLVTVTSDHL